MPIKILIVDDYIKDKNDEISRLPEMLRAAGYEVKTISDGEQAYEQVLKFKPDLVVLDIQFKIQAVDVFEICKAIRSNYPDIPIIIITIPGAETEDVLRGFEAGANDYVIRPRDNREIIARIRAKLPFETTEYSDYLRVDKVNRRVWVKRDGTWKEIYFQPLEFDLLDALMMNAGLVVQTTMLKNIVWGKPVSDDVLMVYIRRLRKKIKPDSKNPK